MPCPEVLRAAIEAGAHYVDTTGEQDWIQSVLTEHDAALRSAGVAAVPGMGFAYLPGDLFCHLVGAPYDCFEKGSQVGGTWRYRNDNGQSAAYHSLHTNTSRRVMEFRAFPMPDDLPDFPSHFQIAAYFDDYVAHFGLREHIRFRTEVVRVVPAGDGDWDVTTRPVTPVAPPDPAASAADGRVPSGGPARGPRPRDDAPGRHRPGVHDRRSARRVLRRVLRPPLPDARAPRAARPADPGRRRAQRRRGPRQPPARPPHRGQRDLDALLHRTGTYSIEKARRLLGYVPEVDLDEGMARTDAWLRAEGLLG